ncbi:MAG: GatB/YqeY domain-containing protein [Chloroflexi bacterium]|nr:GatB/YqeY domain-containing protein [Chloroflexota bacterium]
MSSEQLDQAGVESLARAAIAETGATTPADLGRVMGRLSPETKGRADGRLVSDVVRRLLAGR